MAARQQGNKAAGQQGRQGRKGSKGMSGSKAARQEASKKARQLIHGYEI